MTRGIWLVVSAMLAYGQAGTPRPVFEVASIKPSPPPDPMGYRVGTSGGPGTPDPGRWSAQNYSLKNLIYTAYNLKSYELAAPDWTNSERFDIVAKVPEGASRDDLRLMIPGTAGRSVQAHISSRTERNGDVRTGACQERAKAEGAGAAGG